MEQQRMYRISLLPIGALLTGGILVFLLLILALGNTPKNEVMEVLLLSLVMAFFSFSLIGCSLYLWRKRKAGNGFYWDDEGIVIDLNGNKVYWEEIESIVFYENKTIAFSKATVVHPHYTHHEKIRIRRSKWMPTPAHSIDWYLIEKPKDFHERVMKAWEEKRKLMNKAI